MKQLIVGLAAVAAISWHEAAMFCNWLTSGDVTQGAYEIQTYGSWTVVAAIDRDSAVSTYGTVYVIPTEDEWYKAAYYDTGKFDGAGYWDYPTKHDDPDVPDGMNSPGDTTFDAVFWAHTGANLSSPNDVDNAGVLSAYGTMGQGGNVHEWNETLTGYGSARGVRGGNWKDFRNPLHASSIFRIGFGPTLENYDIGFRVASVVPEPSTLALLAMGAVALLAYAWRRRTRTT